jgi:hypothetical protein
MLQPIAATKAAAAIIARMVVLSIVADLKNTSVRSLFHSAARRAAMIWSAVRPVSSAM